MTNVVHHGARCMWPLAFNSRACPHSFGAPTQPPPPCISYTKVPNKYGPYAYCSSDKAIDAQVQREKIAW